MMTNSFKLLSTVKILVCLMIILVTSHSLGDIHVQANEEDNKSVLDGFNNEEGQAPTESETDHDEQPIVDNQTSENNVEDILQDQSLFGMFFQLFLALAVIIIMIYMLIRFIGKRSQSYQAHRTLQNIGGVHVGANRSIQLVRVGERVLVVGVGESIQLLKEIDDETEIKKILQDYEGQQVEQQFSSMYKWMQTKVSPKNEEKQNSSVYFKGVLERQLSDVKNAQQKAHSAIKEKEQ